ncbi:MAG: 2-oxoglutarate dehydrogenase complex dihydrolipoyllysine-residue succinyltransferase [Kangiellaceae bacterium]|jgi:2-oxoglutarate dehydrogenase E2 component (dihydrolipoamide succinyltransferase)|nr:2-oxoglutarate dehydrogenase complex dihydrolipoyllysine-residue succinyltransferase [Kangiellaceae bacterium]
MSTEIKVPVLPESVADATIATWHKQPGEACARDENLVDIETDKVVLEVVAPDDGVIESIVCNEGDTVTAEQVIATFKAGAAGTTAAAPAAAESEAAPTASDEGDEVMSPAVRRMVKEHGLDASAIKGSGKGGRITKEDVEKHMKGGSAAATTSAPAAPVAAGPREEKRVPMTRLRKRIAERLVDAQQTAAILTTFNDVNMKPVMDIRAKYKEQFQKTHDVKLGFMSFFVKATVEALKRYPAVNASIDGDDIVYHGFFDVGIAVSSPRGLVVPVIRDADQLSMADIEKQIMDYGQKAQNNQLTVDDLTGGTFTVSNGGTFGSLMSTPIINPPQSGILGMHRTEKRPVVENDEIVIRPMMYLAFSYDHRIIDGRESVGFLKTIKDYIEDPARILLEL